MLNAGKVKVSDGGAESVFNDDGSDSSLADTSNCAAVLYNKLVASVDDPENPDMTPQTTVTPPFTMDPATGELTPQESGITTTKVKVSDTMNSDAKIDMKKGQAKLANLMADWLVTYLLGNAEITVTIHADPDGDGGLQNSTSAGDPTDPPDTDKTLIGILT